MQAAIRWRSSTSWWHSNVMMTMTPSSSGASEYFCIRQGGWVAAHLASQQLHGNEPFRTAVALCADETSAGIRGFETHARQLATEVHDTIALPDADSGTADLGVARRGKALIEDRPDNDEARWLSLSPIIGPEQHRGRPPPPRRCRQGALGVRRLAQCWPITYQTLGDEREARRWLDRSAWWLACHHSEMPTDAPRIFEPGVRNPSEGLNASVFYREANS